MIRLVQVGMGSWGRDWAAKVLPQVPGATLVGCVDPVPAALAETQAKGIADEGRCFPSLAAALEQVEADAVLVTTDLPSHVAIATAALEAGKHVLVEKPFAPTVAEGQDAVELADKLALTLMVSQNYRFFPAVRAAQALVREGQLGRLLHVDLEFLRYSAPRPGEAPGHRAWRQPLLLDMSIHHFDLLRAVIGAEPTSVYCRTWNPSWAGFRDPPEGTATIDFAGGTTVSYRGSWICPLRETAWAGEWRMEFEAAEVWWTSRDDRMDDEADAVVVLDRDGARRPLALPRLALLDRAGALDAFVASLESGDEPESAGQDNLGSLALASAAVESAERKEPVMIEARP